MIRPVNFLDRAVACVEEAAVGIWRRRPFVAATVVAIGVSLTFPAMAVVLLDWTGDWACDPGID